MISLWVFAALGLSALVSLVVCCLRLKASRPFGIGGVTENLQRARRLYRSAFLWAVAGIIAFAGALILGLNDAPIWRQTVIGSVVLNIGPLFAGCGFLWSMARGIREQWSPKGTELGLLRETVFGFLFGGLMMLTLYLRFGA